MTRLRGRAPRGQRLIDKIPHGHWKTMTMVSAIRLDGVVREATLLIDGPMNSDTFAMYVEQCLAPSLRPGDVVIMDNLSSHKSVAVRELIESAQADLWYLPPYPRGSPDLNPIENVFSKLKQLIRGIRPRSLCQIVEAAEQSLPKITDRKSVV